MSYSREVLIGSTIWKLFERMSSQVVSFVVSILLARILLPEQYGIIAILLIFINIANVIVEGGLNTALIQKKNADNVDFSTILYVSLILAAFLYILLFFLAPLIAKFYENEMLVPLLRVLSLNLFFNSFNSVQRAYVSKYMLFRKLFVSSFGAVVLSGILGIFMACNGFGVWALVGQQLASQIATSCIMWFTIKWRPMAIFSYERFKQLFDYGWKIFVTNFIIVMYGNIRGLIIGKMYSPTSLAYFERGKSLPALFMENINSSIQTVLLPAFADQQDDRVRVKLMMKRSIKLNCFVTFPLLVGLFVVAESLVGVLLTEKWMLAVPFIRIFSIAYMFLPMQIANLEAIKALGYSNTTLKLEIVKKSIEAIILILSFMINVYAVAWGIVVYNVISLLINLSPNTKLLNYSYSEQLKDIFPLVSASLLMGGITWSIYCFQFNIYITLVLQLFVGGLSYFLFSKLLKVDSLEYIIDIIKRTKINSNR